MNVMLCASHHQEMIQVGTHGNKPLKGHTHRQYTTSSYTPSGEVPHCQKDITIVLFSQRQWTLQVVTNVRKTLQVDTLSKDATSSCTPSKDITSS